MDKLKKYTQILTQFTNEFASYGSTNPDTVTTLPSNDPKHGVFTVFSFGWRNDHRVHFTPFVFRLVGEQIFIESNNTDWLLNDKLVERGVDPEDIVIPFLKQPEREKVPA